MDSKGTVSASRVVPHFEHEADEAQWWFDNKDLLEKDFVEAFENGSIGRGRPWALRYKVAAPASVITLDREDEKLACELAAKRGESYEAFVRRVMHQALQLEKTA